MAGAVEMSNSISRACIAARMAMLARVAALYAMALIATIGGAVAQSDVSPIERFQLAGSYQINARGAEGRDINLRDNGRLELIKAKVDLDSAHWQFVEVSGSNEVRIRNALRKSFLQSRDGLNTAPTVPANGTRWKMEAVPGEPYVRLINANDNLYLVVVDGRLELAARPRDEQDGQWSLTPVRDVVSPVTTAARAPVRSTRYIEDEGRNRAYEAAINNCRELGGYWTGGSCRSIPWAGRRPDCGRGWAWSEDAGECQWDGGDRTCPPWQLGSYPYCQADISCGGGGSLRVTQRGYAVCDCPYGSALRGNYPNFRCGSSIGISPIWLVPVIAGVAIGTLPKILGAKAAVLPPNQPIQPPPHKGIVSPVVTPGPKPLGGAQAALDKIAADKAAAEKIAADKAKANKLTADKSAAEKVAAERAAEARKQDQARADRERADRAKAQAAAEKAADAKRQAQQRADKERAEKARQVRAAAEDARRRAAQAAAEKAKADARNKSNSNNNNGNCKPPKHTNKAGQCVS